MSITLESPKSISAETLLSDIYALDNNELQNEIRHLATMTAAAMCRLLLLVSELDRREAWGDWGVRSCAHWLSWQCGFSLGTSREHVRVARALPELQLVVGLFAAGEISYAKGTCNHSCCYTSKRRPFGAIRKTLHRRAT